MAIKPTLKSRKKSVVQVEDIGREQPSMEGQNDSSCTHPRIGETAPHFTANSTKGVINFPEDYEGKWVILFSHCADFTPVCTSECMVFANLNNEFERYNCSIIGVSPGTVENHSKWIESIEGTIQYRGLKNVKITFPLIEDSSMKIARQYGMMPSPSDAHACFPVRAVFFIDPAGKVRAICYYPRPVGRSFEEIKRVMLALQTSDAFNVATPADWKIGDDIIIPPAVLKEIMQQEEDIHKEPGYQDWYFYSRPLSKEKIIARIFKKKDKEKV